MSNISETLRIQLASHLLFIQKIRLLFYGQTYLGSANEQETYFTYFRQVFMLLPRALNLICLLISNKILDVGQSAHQPLPVPLLQQLLVWVCVDHRDRVRVVRTGQSLHLVPEERIRAIRSYVLQIHYVFV